MARPCEESGVWHAWLVLGVIDLMLGVGVFVWPGASALALLWPVAVAIWAVLGGVTYFVAAGRFRHRSTRCFMRASGVVAFAFGVVLAAVAVPGTRPIVWLVGGHALVAGALMLGVAKTTWSA